MCMRGMRSAGVDRHLPVSGESGKPCSVPRGDGGPAKERCVLCETNRNAIAPDFITSGDLVASVSDAIASPEGDRLGAIQRFSNRER
ncbi:MAG: hypothetical protein D6741_06845 [Planctomycetota bacterium]|nr:MAG: hypothetical protein D6741_06845 [Planctomycetota bacterium]